VVPAVLQAIEQLVQSTVASLQAPAVDRPASRKRPAPASKASDGVAVR